MYGTPPANKFHFVLAAGFLHFDAITPPINLNGIIWRNKTERVKSIIAL
jgi:hypothetical protein